jgi:hypothetical protein
MHHICPRCIEIDQYLLPILMVGLPDRSRRNDDLASSQTLRAFLKHVAYDAAAVIEQEVLASDDFVAGQQGIAGYPVGFAQQEKITPACSLAGTRVAAARARPTPRED